MDSTGSYRDCQCCVLNATVVVSMNSTSRMLDMYNSANARLQVVQIDARDPTDSNHHTPNLHMMLT